ncbi:MAG: outer membrane beta-barrel protein [Pseudomonadota bacterium]
MLIKRNRFFSALLLTGLGANVAHADGQFYLGFGLGAGDVDAAPNAFISSPNVVDDQSTDTVFASEFLVGYQFDNGLTIDLAFDDYESTGILFAPLLTGQLKYNATRINLGYASKPSGRLSFVGKLGLNIYDLELTESPLLNPGPEDSLSQDGTSLYLELGGDWHISQNGRLGLSWSFTDTDAGDVSAIKLRYRYLFGGGE